MNETPDEYWARYEDEQKRRQPIDRPWTEYPVGTQCFAIMGGRWTKTSSGWKWGTNGGTFPTPGGDHNGYVLQPKQIKSNKFTCIKQYRLPLDSHFITVRYTNGIDTFTFDVETIQPEIESVSFFHLYCSMLGKVRKVQET